MARSLSQAVHKQLSILSPRLLTLRAQSNQPFTNLADVDPLDSSDDSPDPEHLIAFRRIEDAVHSIIARRSAPDWIPFSPGSSYWVPPPKSTSRTVAELVGKLATSGDSHQHQQVSFGAFPHQVEAEANSSNIPQPEDEEG